MIKVLLVEGDPHARVHSVTIFVFVASERRSQYSRGGSENVEGDMMSSKCYILQ